MAQCVNLLVDQNHPIIMPYGLLTLVALLEISAVHVPHVGQLLGPAFEFS